MGNLGGGEILVIMLVALLVLGPSRLPDAARQLGRAVAEFRKVSGGFQRELRAALDTEAQATPAAQVPSGAAAPDANPGAPTAPTAPDANPGPPTELTAPDANPGAPTEPTAFDATGRDRAGTTDPGP